MERCTIRLKTGEARCSQLDGDIVIDRLAAYEDTGFEPSDIEALVDDAVTMIDSLADKLDAYRALGTVEELATVKAERDAAVEDIEKILKSCTSMGTCVFCSNYSGCKTGQMQSYPCKAKWRGAERSE